LGNTYPFGEATRVTVPAAMCILLGQWRLLSSNRQKGLMGKKRSHSDWMG